MTKTSIGVQELRRQIAIKAKADHSHRFWGLYCHIWKTDVLMESYRLCKRNGGAPGIDGLTFEKIEESGLDSFVEKLSTQIRNQSYKPCGVRSVKIPKSDGKCRTLKIATIADRVVQGSIKLVLEPIFEMDFQDGSYGYRPRRSAHQALDRVRSNLHKGRSHIIDLDISSFFDEVRHDILLQKIARRVNDDKMLCICRLILKTAGKRGLPQGSLLGPLFSNIFLNEIDKFLEEAKKNSFDGQYYQLDYVRFADDLLVQINIGHKSLANPLSAKIRELLDQLGLRVNQKKSSIRSIYKGKSFSYLGFQFQSISTGPKALDTKWLTRPERTKRTEILRRIKSSLKSRYHHPVEKVVSEQINPRIRGWVNYFRWGNSGRDLSFVRWRVDQMVRRFASRQQPVKRGGRSWSKWSHEEIYVKWKLFNSYQVKPRQQASRATVT